jgi:predicted O-methyltransferase YrrM
MTVVETGVGLGISSNFILQALQDNGFGELHSIDLPKSTYMSDQGIRIREHAYTLKDDMPGSLIHRDLKGRWTLVVGKSQVELPKLCKFLGTIDLFFHDSEHTYDNMWCEYETAWSHIAKKGILASHDIDWNKAFADFAAKKKRIPTTSRDGFGYIMN